MTGAGELITSRSVLEGERKFVTILFADLADSTRLIENLDPEEAARRLDLVIATMREAVGRFEGLVNKVQGDGVMAIFGAPKPLEDHAVRACCAALWMRQAMRAEALQDLAIRIGIHSGEVVLRAVSNDLTANLDAFGIAAHVASRMQQAAGRSEIVLTQATLRAARRHVEVADPRAEMVRGLSEPVQTFRLVGLRQARASQQFRAGRNLAPFVGRAAEMAELRKALAEAGRGVAQVICVQGEAGVGKSRLIYEFIESCRAAGLPVLEARATAHGQVRPFGALLELLRDVFEMRPGEDAADAQVRLSGRLGAFDPALAGEAAFLLDFMGIGGETPGGTAGDPAARRERLFALLGRLIAAAARERTLVILIEDLHWLDGSSAAFLEALGDVLPGRRILLLATCRPGAGALERLGARRIALRPLEPAEVADLLSGLLGPDPSMAEIAGRIAERAGGNPFFNEELVRACAETGAIRGGPGRYAARGEPVAIRLPPTIQALLGARIDRLGEADKRLLQVAAAIGREFPRDVLQRAAALASAPLTEALIRLADGDFIREQSPSGEVWAFKHPLIQETAYGALLAERRRELHGRVAEAIAELRGSAPENAGLVAHHWELAGEGHRAAVSMIQAALWIGTRDSARALQDWRRARELLLPQAADPQVKYLLMMAAGQIVNFSWREGIAAADAESCFREAEGLARELGDFRALTLIVAAYGRLLAASGSADDYVARIDEAMGYLGNRPDASLRATLKAVRCHALRLAGRLPEALREADEALAEAGRIRPAEQLMLGFNVAVWLLGLRAQALVLLGRGAEAREAASRMLARPEGELDDTLAAQAHAALADLSLIEGDAAAQGLHAAALLGIAERSASSYLRVHALAAHGAALLGAKRAPEAVAQLAQALALARERRTGLEIEPRLLADLALANARAGNRAAALDCAMQARRMAEARRARVAACYAALICARLDSDGDPATASRRLRSAEDEAGRLGCEALPRLVSRVLDV
ncbi:MAG: AAA family ATPase [Alphaproteobacteria bacterium]|nr:AAA family ATPase [Alphaproteobacteria bacterium]